MIFVLVVLSHIPRFKFIVKQLAHIFNLSLIKLINSISKTTIVSRHYGQD